MDILQAIILSIVEGITEFLPISSTGHLVLTAKLLNIPQTEFVKSFEIIIQLGGIGAIVFLYWNLLTTDLKVWARILAAFIPTAVIGFLLYSIVKNVLLGNELVTVLALFIGGILLIVLEFVYKEQEHHVASISAIPLKKAFLIGVFQSIAMIPGVSRSATTILAGLFLGVKRKAAVEFSFLLAIPTMLAATILDIAKSDLTYIRQEYMLLLIGFIGSFVVALFTVKFFLKYIQHHTFIPFGVYRIVLAILFWFFIIR